MWINDRRLLGVASAQCVSWGVLFYAFAVVAEPMRRDLGASRAAVAGAFSLGLALTGLAGIAVGLVIERRGVRPVMVVGSAAGALLLGVWAVVPDIEGLYVVWAGLGVVAATLFYEPAFAWATARYHDRRDQALTLITFVGGLASTLFVPLVGALAAALGWRGALFALALLLAGTIPLHAWALSGPALVEVSPRATAPVPSAPSLSLADAVRTAPFWALGGSFFVSNFVTIALMVFVLPWLAARGFSPAAASAAFASFGAVQAPGRLLGGRWVLSRSLPVQLALPFALQALALGLLLVAQKPWQAIVAMGLFGLGNGLVTLVRAGSVRLAFGLTHYAAIGGALGAFPAASRALAPVATAWLLGEAGRYDAVFTAFTGGLAVLALGWWTAKKVPGPFPSSKGAHREDV